MSRAFLSLILLVAVAAAACSESAPLPSSDQPLSYLARRTLTGDHYDPKGLAGKVVIINFWSPT